MDIKRFYTYVPSVEEGGERIKILIANINIAKKAIKYSYRTNVKIDLNGSLYTRRIELDKIDNMKVANNELKISFLGRVKKDNKNYENIDKDTKITIPIKIIDSIEVDVIS